VRRAWWGTFFAGVTLGTIIYVQAVPVAPDPSLCWYWADPAMQSGFWDYCDPPPPY
jgi:hypothetical protein